MGKGSKRIVTLLTDFGLRDPYVAAMKGAVLSVAPDVTLVDITHEVEAHNVLEGAFTLAGAFATFPPGTIHVAVVDPGVGGARRPLLVRTGQYDFLAPDNGLLSLALERQRVTAAFELTARKYFRKGVSPTFHGRDIFAPCAGWLSRGIPPERFGGKAPPIRQLAFPPPRLSRGRIRGEIIHIDRFGNLITNLSRKILQEACGLGPAARSDLRVGVTRIGSFARTYQEGPPALPFALFNSLDLLEIALREGSASRALGARKGDPVDLRSGRKG